MILLVGLGNYPSKYDKTRHNFGFLAIDYLAKKYDFPDFKLEKKFFGRVSTGLIKGQKIVLLKPETFMNLSGRSVVSFKNFYRISDENLFVFSDDLDLDFGKTRFKEKGSSGGQKGIQNIIDCIGSNNFARIKFGITNEIREQMPVENFVLSSFSKEEWKILPNIYKSGIVKFLDWLEKKDV